MIQIKSIQDILEGRLNEARKPKGFIEGKPAHEKVSKIINAGWGKSDGISFKLKSDGTAIMNIRGAISSLTKILDGYSEEHNHNIEDLDGSKVPAGDVSFYIKKISDMEYEAVIK